MDRRSLGITLLVPVASAVLLVVIVWSNFAVRWPAVLVLHPPDPLGRTATSFGSEGLAFGPPLQVSVGLALSATLVSAAVGERRRALGWTVVLSGLVVLLVALGPVRCGFDVVLPIDGRGATYDFADGVLLYGTDYICRTYPSEPWVLAAYGLVAVGGTLGVRPSLLDRIAGRSSPTR